MKNDDCDFDEDHPLSDRPPLKIPDDASRQNTPRSLSTLPSLLSLFPVSSPTRVIGPNNRLEVQHGSSFVFLLRARTEDEQSAVIYVGYSRRWTISSLRRAMTRADPPLSVVLSHQELSKEDRIVCVIRVQIDEYKVVRR